MTKTNNISYFKNVQALRAVAALLVLSFHTYAVEGKYFGTHAVPGVLGAFGTCGVDIFFVISGFVMTTVSRGQFGSWESAYVFLTRRVLRIYPIYWFYSLIVLAVLIVMPQWVNASTGHHADVLRSFLLLPSESLPLILQGWTLKYEMFFYVMFAAILVCATERLLPIALILWAVITCGLAHWFGAKAATSPSFALVSDPLVLEFIAGCFCAMIWPALRGLFPAVFCLVGIAGFAVSFAIGQRVGQDTVVQWRALYFGAPAFLTLLGVVSMEGRTDNALPRWLGELGDASYSLYLSHVLVISAVGRVYARFLLPKLGSPLGTVLCMSIAIVVGYLSYRIVERPLNERLKRASIRPNRVSVA